MSILYSAIPQDLLTGSILDVGCGYFKNQILSRNEDLFITAILERRYQGIDLMHEDNHFNITKIDFFEFPQTKQYDLVLCFEMLEHIEFSKWNELIQRLKGFVKVEGTLLLSVPYIERKDSGMTEASSICPHVVFGIDEDMLQRFDIHKYRYFGKSHVKLTAGNLVNLFIQLLRRNKAINPFRPVWIMGIWKKED